MTDFIITIFKVLKLNIWVTVFGWLKCLFLLGNPVFNYFRRQNKGKTYFITYINK